MEAAEVRFVFPLFYSTFHENKGVSCRKFITIKDCFIFRTAFVSALFWPYFGLIFTLILYRVVFRQFLMVLWSGWFWPYFGFIFTLILYRVVFRQFFMVLWSGWFWPYFSLIFTLILKRVVCGNF